MAVKKIKADLEVVGKILKTFSGTHHLNSATDLQIALEILDQSIYQLDSITENLSSQIDGETDTFQTQEAFNSIRVVLNGLEQTAGTDADYQVVDNNKIQFDRNLNTTERLIVEFGYPVWSAK